MSQFRLALPLAITIAIAPFAIDTYLPSFPAIAQALGVSVHDISLSVAVYVAALAFGQLIGGPLADIYSRQRVMFIGLSIFSVSSFFLGHVSELWQMLALRAVQAFGGGWVIVCVPALVRDKTEGIETAKLFSLIGLIMVAAPGVAPAIGGALLAWQGWSSIFTFLGIYGVIAAVILKSTLFAKEPFMQRTAKLPENNASHQSPSFAGRYLTVLKTPGSGRFIFIQGMVFSVMLIFISHASFIYQQYFGVTTAMFSMLFGANILSMWLVMLLNRYLLGRFAPYSLLRSAIIAQAIAVGLLLLISVSYLTLFLFVPAMMLTVGAVGATSPNSQACYMQNFKQNGGTAAALMGSMQFGISGLISGLSHFLPESVTAIVLAQLACAIAALVAVLWPSTTSGETNSLAPPATTDDTPALTRNAA